MWWNSSQDEFPVTLSYMSLILNETKLVYKRAIQKKKWKKKEEERKKYNKDTKYAD